MNMDTNHCELQAIAETIMTHANESDDHLLKAARELANVKARIERGEFGSVTWKHWSSAHLKLGETRIRELLKLAAAEDGRAELHRQRAGNAERQAHHRKNKAAAAYVRAPSAAAPAEPALRNAAEELIAWVNQAPEDKIQHVLAYIKSMDATLAQAPTSPGRI